MSDFSTGSVDGFEVMLDVPNVQTFTRNSHDLLGEVRPVLGELFRHLFKLQLVTRRIADMHHFQARKQLVVGSNSKVALVNSIAIKTGHAKIASTIFD